MNNQPAPAGRQWLRLASLARLEALGQSPAPAAQRNTLPQPPTIAPLGQTPTQPPRPPTTTAANGSPPPPQQQATSLADSSKPSPPPSSPSLWAPSRSPTPPESPRVIKPANPQEPPRVGQLRPIKAPPPQNPETELKQHAVAPSPRSVFIQQQVNNSNGSSIKGLTDINGKTNSMLAQHGNNNGGVKTIAGINGKTPVNGNQTKTNNGRAPPSSPKRETTKNEIGLATPQEDKHNGEMRSVTMAGENVGAYMDMRSPYGHQHHSIKKQQQQHGHHDHRQTKGGCESQSEEGGESKENKKKHEEKSGATEGKLMASLVNSNVQSINNSILFGTSCTQQSPGVHVSLVGHRQPKHKETI